MKNKFNNLTSKEWLPFQKSWFKFDSDIQLYSDNLRFFTKTDDGPSHFLYYGPYDDMARDIGEKNNLVIHSPDFVPDSLQYAIFDLRKSINSATTPEEYEAIKHEILNKVLSVFGILEHRRFITLFVGNVQKNETYYPYAWDLAKAISSIFSIKDEKIACLNTSTTNSKADAYGFQPTQDVFYCLNFRKDENSGGAIGNFKTGYFENNGQQKHKLNLTNSIPKWFILKPRPRKKNEILHPAKFPENLVEMFIEKFTRENDNVFDPMSGTGSTQLSALRLNRNGYGAELSDFFADIANERCEEFINPTQTELFAEANNRAYKIVKKDAREITKSDFPTIDYMITSPPYWDMLNMKGAENQAKRKEKGLQTNYSESKEDLGNIDDYQKFIRELSSIYFHIVEFMKPGSYLTIVVKNIKKKGQNYPFAWDLANSLQQKLILLPEVFWLQDDISIAPYGYGNTWVSNTFHQYCLNFQVPYE